MNKYEFLKQRNIIDILLGDIKNIEGCKVCMPYKSTNDIKSMCSSFDLEITETNISRWQYFSLLVDHTVKKNKIDFLIKELFKIDAFEKQLKCYNEDQKTVEYIKIVNCIINAINELNKNSDYQLYVQDGCIYVDNRNSREFNIVTHSIDEISFKYIRQKRNEAINDIKNRQFDSALTKARTLLEEALKYKIHDLDIEDIDKLNLTSLYDKYLKKYNIILKDKHLNTNTRNIFSSITTILKSIAAIRNKASDGHGHGINRIELDENITYFYLNIAVTIAEFIVVFNNIDLNINIK